MLETSTGSVSSRSILKSVFRFLVENESLERYLAECYKPADPFTSRSSKRFLRGLKTLALEPDCSNGSIVRKVSKKALQIHLRIKFRFNFFFSSIQA